MLKSKIFYIIHVLLLVLAANCFWLIKATDNLVLIPVMLSVFLWVNIFTVFPQGKFQSFRLKICLHGVVRLRIFFYSATASVMYHMIIAFLLLTMDWSVWLWSAGVSILAHTIIFWNGMISLYCASVQLGIRGRAIGIICGLIPIVNIILLAKILKTVTNEIEFETAKSKLNLNRSKDMLCCTKYPLLLVHGIFFRDYKYINYWGRIPEELAKNGGQIFYGNHHSASSVADSAGELTARIKQIVAETGCQKVNIIAHSKGGLDCRYAINLCGASPYVASLTTINTPHRGCEFAEYLLNKLPEGGRQKIANTYNKAFKKFGDEEPDFLNAVLDLTASKCQDFNCKMAKFEQANNIYCQSVGSKLNWRSNIKFPLNVTYLPVRYFDGENDGLVGKQSFAWGQGYTYLTTDYKRGISHGDMIDLYRENIPGFDVREFYVNLVAGLKQKGL